MSDVLIFQHISGEKLRIEVTKDNKVCLASKMTNYRIIPLITILRASKADEDKLAEYEKITKEKNNEEFIKYLIEEFEKGEMGGGFNLVKVIKNGTG